MYELAVHTVGHSAVSRDAVTEVLDVECSLETRCEETAKGSYQRCKDGHDEQVQVVRRVRDGGDGMAELLTEEVSHTQSK